MQKVQFLHFLLLFIEFFNLKGASLVSALLGNYAVVCLPVISATRFVVAIDIGHQGLTQGPYFSPFFNIAPYSVIILN